MRLQAFSSVFLPTLFLSGVPTSATYCKTTPSSPSWPTPQDWTALNTSLSGHLIKPLPPAAPCHPTSPLYNPTTCTTIQSLWNTSAFHAADPISVDYQNWNNDSCLPDPRAPCDGFGYPVYVVDARSAEDVKKGVDFARRFGVRVVVKGTGHDFLGRSTAPFSLSIWTHNLQNLTFHPTFRPTSCPSTVGSTPALSIAAGHQMSSIYAFAATHNVVVVGGMDPEVGIGGFITGGGHSPLSSVYGLAADNVVEMEVVTAAGEVLVVNECLHADLFWALRGGGGGTFGLLTRITVLAHPNTPIPYHILQLTTPTPRFWSLTTYVHTLLPSLSAAGFMGYYFAIPTAGVFVPGAPEGVSAFIWMLIAPGLTVGGANATLGPILAQLATGFGNGTTVSVSAQGEAPGFYEWWSQTAPQTVGDDTLLGSRLIDTKALTGNATLLEESLHTATGDDGVLLGHLIAGKGVWNAKPRGGGDAVNPAWRKAIVHLIVPTGWTPLNTTAKLAAERQLRQVRVPALRRLCPDSGCYLNEADPEEPNFHQAFWGSNYPRLLEIKKRWDPTGVFYCRSCVGGAEMWTEGEDGRVCRRGY